MEISDILELRLHNQLLTNPMNSPEEIVAWFGAIQAQDYTAAKWAIGLRSQNITDDQIENVFNQGKILRTHVMRPTWHFVLPVDIHWMLKLTAPRVHKINNYYYRQLGLDESILNKSLSIIEKVLQGNTYLTREELGNKLKETNSFTQNINLTIGYMLIHAELEEIICSGPRRGKQFTYALLDERAPNRTELTFEESLAKLTKRYFQSHGPATLQDYVWWSGLTTQDAIKGIEIIKSKLDQEKIGEITYWFIKSVTKKIEPTIHLLPNFDEYIVGYTNRDFIFDSKHVTKLDTRANPLFQHTIILNGNVVGTWKREMKTASVELDVNIFDAPDSTEKKLLKHAINRFSMFINKPVNSQNSY